MEAVAAELAARNHFGVAPFAQENLVAVVLFLGELGLAPAPQVKLLSELTMVRTNCATAFTVSSGVTSSVPNASKNN